MRDYSFLDQVFISANSALKTISLTPDSKRQNPAVDIPADQLTANEAKLAAQLMRVDHAGEVCAQALYMGHALSARSDKIKQQMYLSADEENDHLAWCAERLNELSSRPRYLNPLCYWGSFMIGFVSVVLGVKWRLGFVGET